MVLVCDLGKAVVDLRVLRQVVDVVVTELSSQLSKDLVGILDADLGQELGEDLDAISLSRLIGLCSSLDLSVQLCQVKLIVCFNLGQTVRLVV